MEPTLYDGCPFLVTLGKSYKIPFISHTTTVSFWPHGISVSSLRLILTKVCFLRTG